MSDASANTIPCETCSRRKFLEKSLKGAGGMLLVVSGGALLSSCADDTSSPVGPGGGGSKSPVTIDISQSQFASLNAAGGTAALGANSLDSSGILIYRQSETVFKAYSRSCTHSGCQINPFSGGISSCDCHGSRFNLSGGVVQGPAARSLTQYTATLSGNILTISAG